MLLIAGERLPLEELLSLSCDVLIPAAIPDVITEEVAATLDCKYVVEAANGPTTPEGDKVLRERGIGVLPDVYANGGAQRACWHQYRWNLNLPKLASWHLGFLRKINCGKLMHNRHKISSFEPVRIILLMHVSFDLGCRVA